jgi:hypothetical protein
MATTNRESVNEMENGFEGRGTMVAIESGFAPASGRWIWRVESHEAEMMILSSRL